MLPVLSLAHASPVARAGFRASPDATPKTDDVAALAALGRRIFFDRDLSEPRGTSCASCHDPTRAYSGDNASTVGLPRGSRAGHFARRTSPSLLYLRYVPRFRFFQEGDDPQVAPFGGFFWDGRADSIRELARQPLLNPDEMNNGDAATIAAKVARATYSAEFARLVGAAGEPEKTLSGVGRAIEAYLTTAEMAPFSSRFDAFVRGDASLTPIERRGLALFEDRGKGACGTCHVVATTGRDPAGSLFTDFGYDAVGVPRNRRAPRRPRPDLGLCERRDTQTPTDDPAYCASFRTPSLRNVAVRTSFMHNGAFTRLRDVVAFYATRATEPRRWYRSGVVFDDVPARFRRRINVTSPPYDRHPGDAPALSDDEIDAVVAFLRTLTDAAYVGSTRP
ncbi:MAG TPA: cytochrome c peroxidase [Polyangia bacterium]|nr:cytochrome c peroxidase [Polyangia bacterium]